MSDWKKRAITIPTSADLPEVETKEDWTSRAIDIRPDISKTESLLRGGAQGLTLGYSDEGVGAIEGFWDTISNKDPNKDYFENYKVARDESRVANARAQLANPKTYLGGELGGGVAGAFVPGLGAGALAARVGRGAVAAGTGAAAGVGFSDAEDLKGNVIAGAGGAVMGALGNQAAKGIGAGANALARKMVPQKSMQMMTLGKAGRSMPDGEDLAEATSEMVDIEPTALDIPAYLSGKLGEKFGRFAERKATKAVTGNQARFYDPLVRKGKVEERGRELLDSGVIKFGKNAANIKGNITEELDVVGRQLGDIVDEVDRIAPSSANGKRIADEIRDFAAKEESPNNPALINNLLKQADDFESRGMVPLREAQRIMRQYKWDDRDPATQSLGKKATNKINRILSDEIEIGVEDAKKSIQDPTLSKLADDYKKVKKKYHHLIGSEEASEVLSAREEKNRMFSLTDYGSGGIGSGVGFAVGGPAGAIVGGGLSATGNKVARERGNAALATTADKISKTLQKAPQTFGKFRPILESAAERGQASAGAAHYILFKQNPEYRELIDYLEKNIDDFPAVEGN